MPLKSHTLCKYTELFGLWFCESNDKPRLSSEIECWIVLKGTTIIYCYLFAHFFYSLRVYFSSFRLLREIRRERGRAGGEWDVGPLTFQSLFILLLICLVIFPLNWIVDFPQSHLSVISNSIFLTSWRIILFYCRYICFALRYARSVAHTCLTYKTINIRNDSNIETTICYADQIFYFIFFSLLFASFRYFSYWITIDYYPLWKSIKSFTRHCGRYFLLCYHLDIHWKSFSFSLISSFCSIGFFQSRNVSTTTT